MKQFFFFALLISLSFLTSCGNDDDGLGGPNTDTFMRASIEGENFETSGLYAYGVADADDGEIAIYGVELEGEQRTIYLLVRDNGGVGTYELGFDTQASGYAVQSNGDTFSTFHEDGTGTLTITEKTDERVAGTFTFVGRSVDGFPVEVTSGEFDVAFRE